jgi:hypothetical protein
VQLGLGVNICYLLLPNSCVLSKQHDDTHLQEMEIGPWSWMELVCRQRVCMWGKGAEGRVQRADSSMAVL